MKLKYKPWMSLVLIFIMLGIVGRMDYDDQVAIEQEKIAARMNNTYAGRF